MAAVHGLLLWGLLNPNVVQQALREQVPLFVSFVSENGSLHLSQNVSQNVSAYAQLPAPQEAARAAPPPAAAMRAPRSVRAEVVAVELAGITPPPTPEPMPDAANAPTLLNPPNPLALAAAPSAPAIAAAAVAAPLTPAPPALQPPNAAPRRIPASGLQFSEPPVVEYPKASRRNGESGVVIVRAFVGAEGGAARSVQLEQSCGFVRLDQAALAAVQRARFKPYSDNGRPVDGWALVPIAFELEK